MLRINVMHIKSTSLLQRQSKGMAPNTASNINMLTRANSLHLWAKPNLSTQSIFVLGLIYRVSVRRQISSHPFSTVTITPASNFSGRIGATDIRNVRRDLTSTMAWMLPGNPVVSDIYASALSGGIALSILKFWGETAKRGFFDQKLTRKLVHVSIGLAFMLCWPLFSSGWRGAVLAGLVPGVNIIRVVLLGLGIWEDEATVKSMCRFGDYRELLKGPLYYASTITLACVFYWRTSPIAIAAICNLCAGDGLADIVGRRFGSLKLPYNRNKSFAGSIAMVTAGFIASVVYMHYFSLFGFIRETPEMVLSFFIVSLATTFVESLPISTELDDNLTVPLASILLGSLVF